MSIEQFKEEILWYVREITTSKSTSGPIREAVDYFNSLSDDDKATFIVEAFTLSESCITMYHVVIGTYNLMKKRKEK